MRRAPITLVLLALVAGCGAVSPPSGPGATPSPPPSLTPSEPAVTSPEAAMGAPAVQEHCRPGTERPLRSERESYAAIAVAPAAAYARPGGRRIETFGLENANGYTTVFGVLAEVVDERCRTSWYRVQLPIKPNGAVGYVPADAVALELVTTRIEVDLSDRRIDLFDAGRPVMRLAAGVGAPDTPTPTGHFYVNQRFRVTDADGPYGPAALGISGFSEVLQGWTQGGPIAIHGTNAPDSIGQAASYGCLRVDNEQLLELFEAVPAGTPVVIRA